MNQANKQYLQDHIQLKEQAEQGTLNLDEQTKREFYRILHEEIDPNAIVNLYSQEAITDMVKRVYAIPQETSVKQEAVSAAAPAKPVQEVKKGRKERVK